MPRGGHNRKPRRAKIIQGTFRKDRNPGREPSPSPVPAAPKPPAGMNLWARRLWKRLAQDLAEQQLLTTVDAAALQLTCEAYGLYEEAKQAIYRPLNPLTGKRERRTLEQYLSGIDPWMDASRLEVKILAELRRNSQTAPELAAMNRGWTVFRSYMTGFGLDPASRNRIHLPEPKGAGEDPMEELLRGT